MLTAISPGRIFNGVMTIEDDHRQFLRHVLARTGWKPTHLARKAGLDPSTLNRFLQGGREGHSLRASSLAKIEQVSGLRFAGGPAQAPPPRAMPGFAESEATPIRDDAESPMQGLLRAALAGHNNSDPWLLRSRAIEGLGYRPGDILIVALGEPPRPGDVVCAQIYDWPKGHAETVFRLYQPPCLLAVTGEERLLRPFIVDDAAVSIKGVVIHALRSRATA